VSISILVYLKEHTIIRQMYIDDHFIYLFLDK